MVLLLWCLQEGHENQWEWWWAIIKEQHKSSSAAAVSGFLRVKSEEDDLLYSVMMIRFRSRTTDKARQAKAKELTMREWRRRRGLHKLYCSRCLQYCLFAIEKKVFKKILQMSMAVSQCSTSVVHLLLREVTAWEETVSSQWTWWCSCAWVSLGEQSSLHAIPGERHHHYHVQGILHGRLLLREL